jgi:hypothetical protein
MNKATLIANIKELDKALDGLSKDVNASVGKYVSKIQTMQNAELIATKWFELVEPCAEHFGFATVVESKYHKLFEQLLELSLKQSWKLTYHKTIAAICEKFKEDLLLAVIKSANKISSFANLPNVLENVTDEEKEYLNEALGCAKNGYLRASLVLVWCAAVNRMQKTVEKLGIVEFNKKSHEMKKITTGRFKRFKQSYDLVSINDLEATVFDNNLLWVLEYWGLIDANQHDRLQICFTMRNNAAHPGDATTTEQNLASAFSDIKTMVFDNPKFKL